MSNMIIKPIQGNTEIILPQVRHNHMIVLKRVGVWMVQIP